VTRLSIWVGSVRKWTTISKRQHRGTTSLLMAQ